MLNGFAGIKLTVVILTLFKSTVASNSKNVLEHGGLFTSGIDKFISKICESCGSTSRPAAGLPTVAEFNHTVGLDLYDLAKTLSVSI